MRMKRTGVGFDKPGIPTIMKPNLGELLLAKYGHKVIRDYDVVENFELLDRLEKPVLNFDVLGSKKTLLELQAYLACFPYAFAMITRKGKRLEELSNLGASGAWVYVSRFPNLIKLIREHWKKMPSDLWGLLYGYPMAEVHQFTYDWEEWSRRKDLEHALKSAQTNLNLPSDTAL
jgi:hypothetical protein